MAQTSAVQAFQPKFKFWFREGVSGRSEVRRYRQWVADNTATDTVTYLIAGGSNVPALNELLAPYGIAFGDSILEGQITVGEDAPYYASGANIVSFPAGGFLHHFNLVEKTSIGKLKYSLGVENGKVCKR